MTYTVQTLVSMGYIVVAGIGRRMVMLRHGETNRLIVLDTSRGSVHDAQWFDQENVVLLLLEVLTIVAEVAAGSMTAARKAALLSSLASAYPSLGIGVNP